MPDISVPAALSTLEDLDKEDLLNLFTALYNRGINGLPEDLAGKANQIVGIRSDVSGLGVGEPLSAAGQALGGYKVDKSAEITTATFTLNSSNTDDYTGKFIPFNRASGQTITIDIGAGDGFAIGWYQKGAGQLTFAVSGGLTLRHPESHNKSMAQYAVGGLFIHGTDLVLYGVTTT